MDPLQALLIALPLAVMGFARKSDVVVLSGLLVSSGASALPPYVFRGADLFVPYLMGIEGLFAAFCAVLWHCKDRMRAHAICVVSVLKMAAGWGYMSTLLPWGVFSASLFVGFVLQVFIAGGFADRVGTWLDNFIVRHFPSLDGCLRNKG